MLWVSGIQFPRSFTPSRPLGISWIMLVLCRFGGCDVCFGGFCVLLFFAWIRLFCMSCSSLSKICPRDFWFSVTLVLYSSFVIAR